MDHTILTGLLSAGGTAIILKLIDYTRDAVAAYIRRRDGKLSLEEKVDAISESQKNIAEQLKQTDEVVLATARDRIIHLCRQKSQDRAFTSDDMQEIDAIYQPYHADGGNHAATMVVEIYMEQAREWQKKQATA